MGPFVLSKQKIGTTVPIYLVAPNLLLAFEAQIT